MSARPAKPRLPEPPFYPLPDLAIAWSCSEAQLHVFAEHGCFGDTANKLKITEHALGSELILGVSQEEKARFEGNEYNARERDSHIYLIGALSVMWCIGDPRLENSHYRIRDLVAGDAQRKGFEMLRGRETDAVTIKEGLDLFWRHSTLKSGVA